jgi:hypothetical protein
MPTNLRANLELFAQLAIAIAVLVVAGVLIRRNLFPITAKTADAPRISAGEHLTMPNIDWEKNKKSLVFFLKKDCIYCTSSAPFYRQLIAEAAKRNVKSLAMLPNSEAEARAYINLLQLPIETVQTGSLSSYKISGTPTVLFVDHLGIVKTVWFGAAPEREQEMRDKLIKLFEAEN